MKYLKNFEKIVETPEYKEGDYVYIEIGTNIYYGEIIDVDDPIEMSDKHSDFDYLIKSLDVDNNYELTWFTGFSINRLMTKYEIIEFKKNIELAINTKKYNL